MEKTEDQSRVNRLSALPVDLICHILSFLPTKLSVSTSALSRRWRYMWTHVPTIDFDTNAISGGPSRFSETLNNFLLLYKVQTLNTFSLSPPNYYYVDDEELKTWIEIAVARNVRNVNIRLNGAHALPTIRPLLTCETLVNLSLSHCEANVPSGTVCLPSLKKLRLCFVDIGESLPHLLSGCQVLQELIIQDIFNKGSKTGCVYISSPKIKRLTVDFPVLKIQDAYERKYKYVCWEVKINAPALTYLKVDDFRGIGVSVLPVTSFSIDQADVRLRKFAGKGDYVPSEVEFLDCLCNAESLKLAGYIDVPVSSNVRFDNLTKLELDLTVDCLSLVKLLDSADNLQVLIVELNLASWEDPKRVPKCVSLHLRTIKTSSFVCGHEFNMLRYLARNANVLEMMDLRSANCSKARFDALRRILWFKRELDVCVLAMEREW